MTCNPKANVVRAQVSPMFMSTAWRNPETCWTRPSWPCVHEFAFKVICVHFSPAQVVPHLQSNNYGVLWVWDQMCWDDMCKGDYCRVELMKIGPTCARKTCALGLLVTGSLWTLGRLVRGQYVHWDYLSQGGHEHWGELSKGGVVQGRFKAVS